MSEIVMQLSIYVLDLRGGAPPVIDGIVPEHGPDVDLSQV